MYVELCLELDEETSDTSSLSQIGQRIASSPLTRSMGGEARLHEGAIDPPPTLLIA